MWLLDVLGAVIFLFLYFGLFILVHPRSLVHIAGRMLLGLLYQPFNGGACPFFIFAAAMLPFCVESQAASFAGLLAIGATGAIQAFFLHIGGWRLFYSALFPMIIGAGNTFFAEPNRMNRKLRQANDEIEHLAKVAEREPIAPHLHHLLGPPPPLIIP